MKLNEEQFNEAIQYLEESQQLKTKILRPKIDSDNDNRFSIAFYNDKKLIGGCSLCDYEDDHHSFLFNLEVKKAFRGKGYGTKIMRYLIDNYNIKYLNVKPDNKVAINLYKKFGFKENGKVRLDDNEIAIRMELKNSLREFIECLEESQNSLSFNTPEELYKWMSRNIHYSDGDNYIKTYDRVLKTRSGHCHEQTLFEEVFFRKFKDIKYEKLLMIGSNDKIFKDNTHSCIIFSRNGNYFWFENAWYDARGIHGPFKTKRDVLNAIGREWNKDKADDIVKLVFLPFRKEMKTGLRFNDFMNLGFKIKDPSEIKYVVDLRELK